MSGVAAPHWPAARTKRGAERGLLLHPHLQLEAEGQGVVRLVEGLRGMEGEAAASGDEVIDVRRHSATCSEEARTELAPGMQVAQVPGAHAQARPLRPPDVLMCARIKGGIVAHVATDEGQQHASCIAQGEAHPA